SQVNSNVTVTPANTFNGAVALTTAGLPTGAVASFLPSSVSGGGPSTSVLNIVTTNVAAGSYPFTITGTSGAVVHSIPATLVVDPAALPYPWISTGIGANSSGGMATHASGEFLVTGPGSSLTGTADSFQFTYQPLNGDGTLIARVAQTQNANGVAFAGIRRPVLESSVHTLRLAGWNYWTKSAQCDHRGRVRRGWTVARRRSKQRVIETPARRLDIYAQLQ